MTDTDLAPLLRAQGYRMTEPRRLVWAVLSSSDGHLTAQQIADRIQARSPDINLSSVYRSLTLFAALDLIRESNFGVEGGSRWEPAHPDDHFHLVCTRCGEVTHHADEIVEQVRSHLGSGHGFEAESIELVATGLCAGCAGAA